MTLRSSHKFRRAGDPQRAITGFRLLAAAVVALQLACDQDPTAPAEAVIPPGSLRAAVSTTGGDPDDDGYVLSLGKGRLHPVVPNGTFLFNDLPGEIIYLEVEGVADNCTVAGGALRGVAIPPGGTAEESIAVTCLATGVSVTTVTSGVEAPAGYSIRVGDLPPQQIGANATVQVGRLAPGKHEVTLGDVANLCTVRGGATRGIDVEWLKVSPVTFEIDCLSLTAEIIVQVTTTGTDQPTGYTVSAAGRVATAPSNGTVALSAVSGGTHAVHLGGIPGNCTAADGSERTATVAVGLAARDTAYVSFTVYCDRAEMMAFTKPSDGRIHVAHVDGSNSRTYWPGYNPAWTPDGTQVAYSDYNCDYYWYLCSGGLRVVDVRSGASATVAGGVRGYAPAPSPDGTRILFIHGDRDELVVMKLDGTSQVVLSRGFVGKPSWSPDGDRVAFTRFTNPGRGIYVIGADGSGLTPLTEPGDANSDPAWSPDGGTIAFVSSGLSEIMLIPSDGGTAARLTTGRSPAWSSDGTRVFFVRDNRLFSINVDGSGLKQIGTELISEFALRP